MNAPLAYAAQHSVRLPFRGLVLASNAIGLSMMLAPAVWYQMANAIGRTFNGAIVDDRLANAVAAHIIAAPAEAMLVMSTVGTMLAMAAARQAQALALEGVFSRSWSLAIAFALLCNGSSIASNVLLLFQ